MNIIKIHDNVLPIKSLYSCSGPDEIFGMASADNYHKQMHSLEDAAAGARTVKETVEETTDLRAASMRFQSSGSRRYSGVSPEFANIGRVWKEGAHSKSTMVGLGRLWEGRGRMPGTSRALSVLLWLLECRAINQRADCNVSKWEDTGNQKGDRKSEQLQGKSGGPKGSIHPLCVGGGGGRRLGFYQSAAGGEIYLSAAGVSDTMFPNNYQFDKGNL